MRSTSRASGVLTAVRNAGKGGVVMSRITRILLLSASALLVAAPSASASTAKKLDDNLASLWTTVLETPAAENPFATETASACWNLGRTVAPFGPSGVESCTVPTGTMLFVVGNSVECSTFEGNGTTEAELRACARQSDVTVAPTISVDGNAVAVAEVETPLLEIVLPADNLFGQPAGTEGLSVAHGWVTLLQPLTPGVHSILIGGTTTTTIVVTAGR
jgi:hypothetical protein